MPKMICAITQVNRPYIAIVNKAVIFSRDPKAGLINRFEHVTLVLCLGKLVILFNTEEWRS